ncbi:DUF2313 domain-containing protein [Crassaminicella thermophila]|uniref:DUF2313 domain-containing protein n=1 Tax=Crassaminicella thermophila TaxID=2599308 RepID=A0A5C0SFN4_CRATE|nr:putative phage tail protein [Crassaminicella thermophila]QEK12702.1 DUF2313 domain-containing protein [Crassaminicella thermophila]
MLYKEIIKNQLPDGLYKDNGINDKELNVLGKALDDIQNEIDKLEIELLLATATDEGLEKYEELLNIPTDILKPIDQRRSVIIGRIRGNATVTKDLIKSVAESYDKGTVEVIENFESYIFIIKFIDTRGIPPNIEDLKAAIEEIKPAHLAVEYEFTYTVWSEVKNITWNDVKTGTWDNLKTRQIIV